MSTDTLWQSRIIYCLSGIQVHHAYDMAWHSGRTVIPHTHDFYQLDYFYAGDGSTTISGRKFAVRAGDLFIANPGERHEFRAADERPMQNITLKFSLPGGSDLPAFPSYIGNLTRLSRNQQLELEHYLRRTCIETNNTGDECPHLASTMLSAFFLLLIRYLRDAERYPDPESGLTNIQRVAEYIKEHYHRTITLDDLARIAGLHPQYFCHKFSQEMGISPIAALTRERMEAARKLLADTRLPVSEVGIRVGYTDAYHFSKRFKDAFGMSPLQFRKDRVRYRHVQMPK